MENNYFDKIIRAKLENLEASNKAEGWELLQHRIDADPELNGSEDIPDPIDEIVKSKLEGTKAAYEPGSWALMENLINADADLSITEMDDVVFDGIAYENLSNLETPYNPSHWELMARRIQEEFSWQHRLYRYKIAEISLMLFAIFTLLQFLPFDQINTHKKNNTPVAEESNSINQLNAIPGLHELSNEQQTVTTRIAAAEAKASDNNAANIENTTIASIDNINSILAKAKVKPKSETSIAEKYVLEPVNIINQTGTSVSEEAIIGVAADSDKTAADEAVAANEQQAAASTAKANTAEPVIPSIAELLYLESERMEDLTYEDNQDLPNCIHCKRKKPLYLKVGMMAATDLNYIMTPHDVKFEEESYGSLFTGYSGGITFGFQRGKWELATGVIYSSKRYEPKTNLEYTGSLRDGLVAEGFEETQLNLLSIPLNFHYTYANAGKWQLYSLAGASANLAAINHFDFKTYSVSNRNGLVDPRIKEDPHGEKEPTYDGALEGGKLSDNIYFTVNLGLGAERYLTPRWSVFFQPVYQHSVLSKGLGPNKDRINTFSIFAGAKATLR